MFFKIKLLGPDTNKFLNVALKSLPRCILISSMKSGSIFGIVKFSPMSPKIKHQINTTLHSN